MVYLTLKGQKFTEVHIKADINEPIDLELESRSSFNVNYVEDNSACISCLKYEVRYRENPSKFSISVEAMGQYACEGVVDDEARRQAHIQAYMLLFPYVQNMISQMTVSAGMPPLVIEMTKMKEEEINLSDEDGPAK